MSVKIAVADDDKMTQ